MESVRRDGVAVQIISQKIADRMAIRLCTKSGTELERVLLTAEFPSEIPLADAGKLCAALAEELRRQGSPIVLAPAHAVVA